MCRQISNNSNINMNEIFTNAAAESGSRSSTPAQSRSQTTRSNGESSACDAVRRPLHLLIVSNTNVSSHVYGADRDWVNLLNSLGPGRVRVTWAGVRGTELLRGYLDKGLDTRTVDLGFAPFDELFHDHIYRQRTLLSWAGIVRAYLNGLRSPLKILDRALANDPPNVVITGNSVVLIGAAYALRRRLPHVWCVKEFLDPSVRACRNYARIIECLSNAVVVPSEPMARIFSPRVHVLHDGNDLEGIRAGVTLNRRQALEKLGLPTEQPVIAQVGTVSRAKGQQVTAMAFAQIARQRSQPCSLLFLGRAPPHQKAQVEAALAAAPADWRANVRFAEFGPGDFSYVAAADIVVHPSVLPDPYPNAVREALILGKPVIGSEAGGIPQIITHGENGLLVSPDDADQLADAISTLLDDPEKRRRMGEAALKSAAEKFDVRACKRPFCDLLMDVISRRRAWV